ncbi:MAG: hypothetical protein LKJ90_08525 [Faecalibacterium sp.]|nr:hypothetical protein [Faecalibacterium sp.]
MRNAKFLFLALAAGLLLSGCGAADASSASAASIPALPSASSQAASAGSRADIPCSSSESGIVPIEGALTPEDVGRPATTKLSFCAEGISEEVPATLYIGDGYSIYLPDGAWHPVQAADAAQDTPDVFQPDTDQISLSISFSRSDLTLQQAYDALLSEGCTQSDDNDAMFCRSAGGVMTCWYVTEASGQIWYVEWSYPDTSEYLEGWGTSLPVIAETFAVNPPAVS